MTPLDPADGAAIAERAVLACGADACHVLVESTSQVNQRWARNSLTTNGLTHGAMVTVVAMRHLPQGVATASVARNVATQAELTELVRDVEGLAATATVAPDATDARYDSVDPDFGDRAPVVLPSDLSATVLGLGEFLRWSQSWDVETFGYLEKESSTLWLATSTGARRRFTQAADRFEVTAKGHQRERSTWHGSAAANLSDSFWERLRQDVTRELAWQGTQVDIAPGRHDVVLPPGAIGDLMVDLLWAAGARDAVEGRTAFHEAQGGTRLGQQVADSRITLSSDPADLLMPTQPFAATGFSSRQASVFDNGRDLHRTDWIAAGVLQHLHTTGFDSQSLGIQNTPMIGNIRLDAKPEAASIEELVSGVDQGLLLTCIWYNRMVDPQRMLLTGLTRDGVYVIRNGEIIGASGNFRFNDSPLSMLNRVIAAAPAERTLPREMADYANRVTMPAISIEGMNFTSPSEAR